MGKMRDKYALIWDQYYDQSHSVKKKEGTFQMNHTAPRLIKYIRI